MDLTNIVLSQRKVIGKVNDFIEATLDAHAIIEQCDLSRSRKLQLTEKFKSKSFN